MSGDCPRIVAPSTSCDCVRPCSSKWPEKNFGMDLKQLSREELEIAFYNIHTKNECLSKALKDNVKQIKRLNKIVEKNEEDRRRCLSPTKQLYEDRISQLEQANTFLQDKVLVLRHQLQSHSRLHAKAHRNSSHISRSIHSTKTSQTHLSQLPIPNSENINRDEKQDSKEDLNVDLVENDDRISQLQNELDQNPSDAAKVAENIELIRLRRLVKRQASQLSTLNAHLEVADKELDQLRSNYNEASLENDSVLRQLMTEKQRLREVQNELIELGNLKQDIKILQEQVRDLQSERSLLRSNNDKLLEIASGKSEEDTSQQPKNDADKEIEKDAKEETEKIYSQKSAVRSCSHYKINTILEDVNKYSVSKRVSGIFVKHNWFKELFAKAGSANTYDLDIEPCTEVSLLKAFSHQELSDLFSKEFICPSTLNYTIMPLIQLTDNSMEGEDDDDDDDKKNEKVEEMSEKEIEKSESENKIMSGENDSASKNFDDGDDRNVVDERNSELSLNEAKFVFMQILKHELENYDSASNQLLHDGSSENEETNTSYENNQAENSTTFRQPSNLVDYFWGIVGYKIFFPKKSQKIVEISKHPENDISNNVPGTSKSYNPPPYYTISISDKSFETSNSIEGCILQIENVDNKQCKRDCSATNQEPKFDIGSEESQAIEITSYHTINSDLPQTSEEFIPGDFETKSKAQGDASTTNSAGMSSSTLGKSSSEKNNDMFNIDAAPNLPRIVAHDEKKDSAAERGSKDSKHSQTATDQFQVVNDSNKCSCKSSQGAGQYILEEHKPDSSRNVNDSKTNNIQYLPDQEKTTFTVYNLNRETGSRDKIGILFLKKISCECNLKSITGRQTKDNQVPSPSNNSETDHFGDKQEAHPEKSGNFQPKEEHKPDGDNEQKQLNNDENEMNHPFSVDSGAPLSENQKFEGFESAPLLTLLRRLLQKFLGEPENETSGPRFSVDDVVIESPHVNNSDSAAQSSYDNALTRNAEHDNANNIVQNNTNNIVKILKDGLAPLSATKSFERNCESSTSKQNKSLQRSSDPGLSRFNTKSIETRTYNRRSTNKNEKIGKDYHASSGQTLKTMAGTDDNFRQNSNPLLTNSPRSSSRSPDRKISQPLNKDDGIPLSTDPPISVNRSPDRKTPQTLNDKNHGKPSEVVKTTPTVRDKLPKKMIRENSQNTKSTETQTYNRRSTDKNDKIGQDYHVSRGQTLKTMAETDDSFRQNSNPLPRSRSRSPDIKISQTLNKDNGKPLSNNPPRSVNKSPDRKTPQTFNDKYHGKPSEVVKTTPTVRDRLPKNMIRENSVKSFELKKQVTPHDCLSTNPPRSVNRSPDRRTPQTLNDKNHGKPSEVVKTTPTVRDRSKTPRSKEGPRCLPYKDKIFQPPSNQPHKCVESSEGNDEVCERNLKLRSATSKPICSHERELITNVKKFLELLNQNFDSNENYSADESNDESDSLCSDRRMAFCTAEDDGRRIGSPQNSGRISSGHNDCSSTQLSSEQSLTQECPTCLNKKLRLQQMNVSNDSPFSKNPKLDKRLINHEVDRSDRDTHRNRSRHPEMIIVVGKKLTIYESDKTEEK